MNIRGLWKSPACLHLLSAVGIAINVWRFRLRFPFDDTFISFRYAENLANGYGLVWNIGGSHTEGYTNFLFILILSITHSLTSDQLVVAQAIGIASTIATSILLYDIASRLRNVWTGLIAALFYSWTPLTWVNALSGMETSLFVMLVILTIALVVRERYNAAFAVAFLATLTRPEGALLAVIAFCAITYTRERRTRMLIQMACYFAIPALAYGFWKYFYFGQFLPNSFYVKVLYTSHVLLPGLQYVRLWLASVGVIVIASFGIRRFRDPALLIAIAWSITLALFYLFVRPLEGLYDRFLLPGFATLCITAAVGLTNIPFTIRPRVRGVFALLLVAVHLLVSYSSARTRQAVEAHEDVWDASMDRLVSELRMMPYHDSLTLAYGDAGYVVFKSGVKHVDLFGLNDTRIAHAKPRDAKAEIVKFERPDLLILPAQRVDSCFSLVEDAYGLVQAHEFTAVAMFQAFPYDLILYSNSDAPFGKDLQSYLLARTYEPHSALLPAPCLK